MAEEKNQEIEEPEPEVEEEVAEEDAEKEAEEKPETAEPRQATDEMKVVIVLKGGRAMIGVQSPDCDPIFNTVEGDLAAALAEVPALVESANAKWDANPRYPKADLPKPPTPEPAARHPAQGPPSKPKQPSFF